MDPLGCSMCCLMAISVSFTQSVSIDKSSALSHIALQNSLNSSLVVDVMRWFLEQLQVTFLYPCTAAVGLFPLI